MFFFVHMGRWCWESRRSFFLFFRRTLSEVQVGRLDIVTVLLAAGAEVNAHAEEGETALTVAVKKRKA